MAPPYDGLAIELQLRSKIQHAWATAVETVGTFVNESLKSSEGSAEWLNFFSLTSSAFAFLENSSRVPQFKNLSATKTYRLVSQIASDLNVIEQLSAYRIATRHISRTEHQGSYHLIVLNLLEKNIGIRTFGKNDLQEANVAYSEIEREISAGANKQAVLVATNAVDNLRRAYPNYFLDTQEFILYLEDVIARGNKNMIRKSGSSR